MSFTHNGSIRDFFSFQCANEIVVKMRKQKKTIDQRGRNDAAINWPLVRRSPRHLSTKPHTNELLCVADAFIQLNHNLDSFDS